LSQQFAPLPWPRHVPSADEITAARHVAFFVGISFHWLHASTHCCSEYAVKENMSSVARPAFWFFAQV
jgi:hypothetical protein